MNELSSNGHPFLCGLTHAGVWFHMWHSSSILHPSCLGGVLEGCQKITVKSLLSGIQSTSILEQPAKKTEQMDWDQLRRTMTELSLKGLPLLQDPVIGELLAEKQAVDLKKEEKLRKNREAMKRQREGETAEQREDRLRKNREAMRLRRQIESDEQRGNRLRKNREAMKRYREMETEEQRDERLRKNRELIKSRRQQESQEQRQERLRKNWESTKIRRQEETEEEREHRLRRNWDGIKRRREQETEEQRKKRLRKNWEGVKNRRQRKNEGEKEDMLCRIWEAMRQFTQQEMQEDRDKRCHLLLDRGLVEGTQDERLQNREVSRCCFQREIEPRK
ncbi:trichohyalin-like isoform X1 [Narcine bancroftii]|uniref:trichohyalin-like isoform X1 n=1 Tax=Narcine bancroftii TaxID=1343680 RepID=UPI0038310C90